MMSVATWNISSQEDAQLLLVVNETEEKNEWICYRGREQKSLTGTRRRSSGRSCRSKSWFRGTSRRSRSSHSHIVVDRRVVVVVGALS